MAISVGAALTSTIISDASTEFTTNTDGGSYQAVLVFVICNGDATDGVTSVSYGPSIDGTNHVSLSRIISEGLALDNTGEIMQVQAWFRNGGLPSGSPTPCRVRVVTNTWGNGDEREAGAILFGASGDVEVQAARIQGDTANPQVDFGTQSNVIRCVAIASGLASPASLTPTPLTDHTSLIGSDYGNQCARAGYYPTPSTGVASFGWVSSSDDVAMIGVIASEAAPAVTRPLPFRTNLQAAHRASNY